MGTCDGCTPSIAQYQGRPSGAQKSSMRLTEMEMGGLVTLLHKGWWKTAPHWQEARSHMRTVSSGCPKEC